MKRTSLIIIYLLVLCSVVRVQPNVTKHLAGFPDKMYLLPENIIDSVAHLKKDILNGKMVSLDVDETLIVLGISALSNPAAKMALENLICDPEYSSKSLFISG
jgi:uncharacterized protein (UPF0371 family)